MDPLHRAQAPRRRRRGARCGAPCSTPAPGRPLMQKHTTDELAVPSDGWIAIGDGSRLGPDAGRGRIGATRWSLRLHGEEPELRHLSATGCTGRRCHAPSRRARRRRRVRRHDRAAGSHPAGARLAGDGGSQLGRPSTPSAGSGCTGSASRRTPSAWLDVALGRVLVAGRLTPWVASGAISVDGRAHAPGRPRGARAEGRGERGALHAHAPRRGRPDGEGPHRHAARERRGLALRRPGDARPGWGA